MRARQQFGVLLLAAAAIAVGVAFSDRLDATTCQNINSITPGACSTAPNTTWLVVAGVLAFIGVLMILAPHGRGSTP